MNYFGTTINESPVIVVKAGETMKEPQFLAVTADGKLATAGANAIGLITPDCEDAVAVGDDLTVQVKDIGLWLAGEAIALGDELAVGDGGKAVKATAGAFITAVALSEATKADQRVSVQICKAGYKAAASSAGN